MALFDTDDDLLSRVSERVGDILSGTAVPAEPRSVEPKATFTPCPESLGARQVWNLPGIYAKTRISTNFGEVPAHLVRENDRIRTRDDGFLPVLRIQEYHLDEEFLLQRPDAKPVTLRRGTLKHGMPQQDVHLSPGQKVLSLGQGTVAATVPARSLTREGMSLDGSLGTLSYYVFHLGQSTLIRSEGIWLRIDLA